MNIRLTLQNDTYCVRLLCDYCDHPIEKADHAHCVWDMHREDEPWGAPLFVMHAACDRVAMHELPWRGFCWEPLPLLWFSLLTSVTMDAYEKWARWADKVRNVAPAGP